MSRGAHPQPVPLVSSERPAAYGALIGTVQPFEKGDVQLEIPITGYDAGRMALVYGYSDLGELCRDLPHGAEVLDVAAGASTLGLEVCNKRADVKWVNVDPVYDRAVRRRLKRHSPPNLRFLEGDVFDLDEVTDGHRYHRVLSFRLLPHLRIAGSDIALEGLHNLLQAGRLEEGRISVGPIRQGMGDRLNSNLDSITVATPATEEEREAAAKRLLVATTQPFLARLKQAQLDNSSRRLPF